MFEQGSKIPLDPILRGEIEKCAKWHNNKSELTCFVYCVTVMSKDNFKQKKKKKNLAMPLGGNTYVIKCMI